MTAAFASPQSRRRYSGEDRSTSPPTSSVRRTPSASEADLSSSISPTSARGARAFASVTSGRNAGGSTGDSNGGGVRRAQSVVDAAAGAGKSSSLSVDDAHGSVDLVPTVLHSAESNAAPGHAENERLEKRKPAFVVLALPPKETAGSGVYHFIRVLRSASLNPDSLQPIVVLVGEEWQVDERLRRFMALFPLVYYHVGHLEMPRSLLRACLRGSKVSSTVA